MGYRRKVNLSPISSRWRLRHRAVLNKCGIPSNVADSDQRWTYVLLHGDDHLETGWDTTWISGDQAKKLLEIFERDLESETGFDLFPMLRKHVAR